MTSGAIRAATDVGGTFTDLVYFATDPETGRAGGRHGASRHHAARLRAGRAQRARGRAASTLADIAFLAHGTTVVINALDRAQGREDGADHDRGLPRLARDRARQPAGLLQPTLREAAAVRAALSPPRGAGPDRRTTGEERRAARPVRPAGDPRRLPRRRASRRSRSASSTPTPTRRTSRRCSREVRELWPEVVGRRLAPDHPRVARVRADQHDRALGLRAADRRALPRPARRAGCGEAASAARSTSCSRTAASTRSRRRSADPDHHGRVGAGQRLLGRGRARPAASASRTCSRSTSAARRPSAR